MQNQKPKNNKHALLMSVAGLLFLQFFSHALFAAPGDVLFTDDFERAALGAAWTVNSGGGDAGIGTYTSQSGTRSLYTRWDTVSVTSGNFNLSAVAGAQLDLWVRRGADAFSEDPEVAGNEDLVVEFYNDTGSWQEITRYVGGGTPGEIFTSTFYLPANALHASFAFRFRQPGGNGSDWDYWHVDDVVLTETAGLPTLAFPFCDDFESGTTNWQIVTAGGDAGTGTQTASSASNSLYLRWGVVDVTSFDIDLSAQSSVYLNFWLRRGADSFSEDPDNNEDFTVEYYNSSGAWITLGTFPGNGSPGQIFNNSYALPANALHSAFKVRFSMTGGNGSDNDYWHVDDVCVAGPPAPPSALALYHLDETSWGAVTDSSGNGFNGSVVGGVVPDNTSPATAGDPGTCGYADIPFNNSNNIYDAIDTGVDVNDDIGNTGTIDFWYKSNVRWNGNNGDRQLLDASTTASGQKYFYLTLLNNSRLNFGLEDSNDNDFTIESGNNSFNANVWVHIAVTWDLPNDRMQLYINGNLEDDQTFSTNGVLGNVTTLYLGDNRSTYQVGDMTGNSANGSIDEVRIYDFALSQAEIQTDMNVTHPCGSTLDHFVVGHDGFGINCLTETNITVTATKSDGSTYTGYTGTITLDTQSTKGTWTLNTGTLANFTDATADDGLATYTFDVADNGVAIFDLSYQSGTPSINIDAYEGAIRDDDTEPNLVFSPSGYTVTNAPLAVPFLGVVDTVIPAKTAATDFTLYLAAFGQTPTDPTCGIIEEYTGAKNVKFWSSYVDPGTGTLPVMVNTINAFGSEVLADLGGTQPVTFTNGQASVTVNYADVGQIKLDLKDDTVTADLLTGIRGASSNFVVKPAGFVLSNIMRTSDSFPNPGTAVDENSAAFMAAGDNFSVTVTAVNSLGVATPNYGQESTPETVLLTPTLVAAGAANNPAIAFTTGFDGFVNGVDTGTDFHWDEVGIITLTPGVTDYLGDTTADVTGITTGNIGRFYPDHFITALTNGSFQNICTTGTAFTYVGESFGYLSNPDVTATARSATNLTTANYTGNWAKLGTGGVSLTYPNNDNSQLDEGGVNPILVTSTPGMPTSLSRTDNANGSLTFILGGSNADSFVYDRSLGQVVPFTADLTIQLTAINDGEATASDLATPKNISPIGNQLRAGQSFARDVHGTMGQAGESLLMPVGTEYYTGALTGWQVNPDDSCSSYQYCKSSDSGLVSSIVPVSPVSVAAGQGDLTISITSDPDTPDDGGQTIVSFDPVVCGVAETWPVWLPGPDRATATFGIFRGDDRFLYWRESP